MNGATRTEMSRPGLVRQTAPSLSDFAMLCIVFIATYFFSRWLLEHYTEGDLRYYSLLYDMLRLTPLDYLSEVQFQQTGSREPLYGIFMWLSAPHVERTIAISLVNSIFTSVLYLFLRKHRSSALFMILVASNFYILVLLTSAERLKFAYLFAILAALLPAGWRVVALLCSLLSHFSILIVFSAILLPPRYREAFRSLRAANANIVKSLTMLILTTAAFIAFCFLYRDSLTEKIGYYESPNVVDVFSGLILSVVALFITNNRLNMVLTLAFPLLATLVFGGSRINMLTMTIFVYMVVNERKTSHPAVILIMLYLSYKSIGFVQSILKYGTGFLG